MIHYRWPCSFYLTWWITTALLVYNIFSLTLCCSGIGIGLQSSPSRSLSYTPLQLQMFLILGSLRTRPVVRRTSIATFRTRQRSSLTVCIPPYLVSVQDIALVYFNDHVAQQKCAQLCTSRKYLSLWSVWETLAKQNGLSITRASSFTHRNNYSRPVG